MAAEKTHPFHLVNPSPWPFVGAIAALICMLGLVLFIHEQGLYLIFMGAALMLFTMVGWWRDVLKESEDTKTHTLPVQFGIKMGMALFITSEVMFFVAFFWAFFNASLFPTPPTGGVWPPKGIHPLNPFDFPYFNTLVLLLSGTTITWAHHAILGNHKKEVVWGIGFTVLLGFLFTSIQAYEYMHATFGFKEGIYATTFYMATGFHGAHVIIGTLFLSVCWFLAYFNQFTPDHHIGLEAAAWYWHFVDVVWLFLFVFIYLWGSGI
ncbi:MAG: CytoChrome c oxidase subunit 3 (Cytochrome c oxidasepolypeptide III) [uncultured bacterium]|nr:MAG: CytoChrome c oxidase subunit 3 (Cytochrome c oxidasepolypeptide III) [uncultured bacterium]OFW68085.1 MAG: cytochrome B562 [Alphaproteobacteria bacterium GWC2_42_16]OFW73475.1 MAG: cytochrome B562 [Alphaproteobacteria bacterium GWA2_41_27]OFW82325.1 MAG: cytochrome B562 [Alphaproteobacteria bacterium RIFCSPHIGHO2_12_FULL_42_100]OFW86151.1 MAG: cytochrome B562 [Alphaproteobacteria bacterium RBG_16_42_14]OFW91711.1 MAG: cytochrome B562 [Alphaproteobacteria bacterium RIFCSPHIGHO2_02_FULL_